MLTHLRFPFLDLLLIERKIWANSIIMNGWLKVARRPTLKDWRSCISFSEPPYQQFTFFCCQGTPTVLRCWRIQLLLLLRNNERRRERRRTRVLGSELSFAHSLLNSSIWTHFSQRTNDWIEFKNIFWNSWIEFENMAGVGVRPSISPQKVESRMHASNPGKSEDQGQSSPIRESRRETHALTDVKTIIAFKADLTPSLLHQPKVSG